VGEEKTLKMLERLWDDLTIFFSMNADIIRCIYKFMDYMFGLLLLLLGVNKVAKKKQESTYEVERLSQWSDFRARDKSYYTIVFRVKEEDVIVVIRRRAIFNNTSQKYDWTTFICAGCYRRQKLDRKNDFYTLSSNSRTEIVCRGLMTWRNSPSHYCEIFRDLSWRLFLTKQRKHYPKSLKIILKAWLLCCKRAPLKGLPKDLRYLMCDYIVEEWKREK